MEEIIVRWLILAAVFLVGELAIRSYYLFAPCSGALISSVASNVGFPFWGQWTFFFFISIILALFVNEMKKSE